MTVSIRIAAPVWERLRGYHLAAGKNTESLSYIWAQAQVTAAGVTVLIPHTAPVLLFHPDCFRRQTAGNVQLDPAVLNGMLVRFAASPYNTLINVHDHWFHDTTRFSGIDDQDDLAFDRYLRQSFEPMLAKHPHLGIPRPIINLSLVLAQRGLDARLVNGHRNPPFEPVTAVSLLGERFDRLAVGAPAASLAEASREVFNRQRDFIPDDRQELLSQWHIALVGCGGLGSILAESLARIGVGGLTLIDDDTLETSNLNRWQGATPRAVGKAKAAYLGGRLRRLFPRLRVRVIGQSVFAPASAQALAASDLIIAGLDNDEARYFLNRVSIQYSLPYFDAGVAVTGSGDAIDFQVRCFAVLPGVSACAECTQFTLFDREATVAAFLDEATAKSRRAAGYVLAQPQAATPSVYALNQRAAALLVTELLNYLCGWRPTATLLAESWREGRLQRADRSNFPEGPDPECPVCSFYAGAADSEPLPRPNASFTTLPTQEVPHG